MVFPGKLQLIAIIVGVVALVGVPAWLAYGAGQDNMRVEAEGIIQQRVGGVIEQYEQRIALQEEITATYRNLSDTQYTELLKGLETLQGKQSQLTFELDVDRATYPEFYNRPIPSSGRKQWEEARKLLQ